MYLVLWLLILSCFAFGFNFEVTEVSFNKSLNSINNNNQRRDAEMEVKKNNQDEDYNEFDYNSALSKTTLPLIIPAPARITISLNAKKILKKRKKNFSKMAKSLILLNGSDYDEIQSYLKNNTDNFKFPRSFTKSINGGEFI